MEMTLDDDHVSLLRRILDGYLRDLRMEIAGTDDPEYRRGLQAREQQVRGLLGPLGGPLPDGA